MATRYNIAEQPHQCAECNELNAGDSLDEYVTPSQLQVVSGGSVYVPGDSIIRISGNAISVDTVNKLLTRTAAAKTYTPTVRKVNNKTFSNDITILHSDIPDLTNVYTADLNKPLSNPMRHSLAKKLVAFMAARRSTLAQMMLRMI